MEYITTKLRVIDNSFVIYLRNECNMLNSKYFRNSLLNLNQNSISKPFVFSALKFLIHKVAIERFKINKNWSLDLHHQKLSNIGAVPKILQENKMYKR